MNQLTQHNQKHTQEEDDEEDEEEEEEDGDDDDEDEEVLIHTPTQASIHSCTQLIQTNIHQITPLSILTGGRRRRRIRGKGRGERR